MHLIDVLACGVRGAENGTVELYAHGTSTRATWYQDFEGGTAVSTGEDITLDSNGGAEIYVNQLVDVVVRDTGATEIRRFIAGSNASGIEYIGPSFTGVDYVTGEIAVNKPVTLQTVLDLWATSSGSVDFEVLLNSVSRTLESAMSPLAYVFCVKDPLFGAVGDAVTDDTVAIQNCLEVAGDAGGGTAYFPTGTYRTTGTLSVPANVNLIGDGLGRVNIYLDHASATLVEFPAAGFNLIQDLSLRPSQANTGYILNCSVNNSFIVANRCVFGDETYTRPTTAVINYGGGTSGRFEMNDCTVAFNATSATGAKFIVCDNVSGRMPHVYTRCFFGEVADGSIVNPLIDVRQMVLRDCVLYAQNCTTACTWIAVDSSEIVVINGSRIQCSSGGYGISITAVSGLLRESGNVFTGGITYDTVANGGQLYAPIGATDTISEMRETRVFSHDGGATTDTVSFYPNMYRTAWINIAGTQNFVISVAAGARPGQRATVIIKNETGAPSGTVSMNSPGAEGLEWEAGVTCAAGDWRACEMIWTGDTWFQTNDDAPNINP